MKVVFSTLFRESMGGGMGRVAYEIAEAFAKEHQVLLVCPGKSTRLEKKNKNLNILKVETVGKGEVAISLLNKSNIDLIFKYLRKFSPEIIHAQDPGPISFLLQLWAKQNAVPFIYTSHILPTKMVEFGAKEFIGQLSKIFEIGLVRGYFVNFFSNCDAVIALNESARRDIKKFGYSGKIFLIPNGRDLSLYQNLPLANISSKKKKLIFIGYLSSRKNQLYLVRVMKYLPKNYFLILVGEALHEYYLEKLKKEIEKYNLTNICLMGKVPYEKIPSLLRKSHLFVSASKMEVQSLVVLEALAAGKPVVGLANETINEFVDETVGFNLSKRTSAKEFAARVKMICEKSFTEYQNLCLNARQKVAHLDWQNVVKLTAEVYQEIRNSFQKSSYSSFRFEANEALEELRNILNVKNNLFSK